MTGQPAHRGSAATELALVTPALVALLLLVAVGGRLVAGRGDVDSAARDAARAASIARDVSSAQQAARSAATAALADPGAPCRRLDVEVDTAEFQPGGSVTVQVICDVRLADLALLRLPGGRPITGRATAVIDLYRGTQ